MHGFEENGQKPYFGAKMANFWTKKGSKTAPQFFFVRILNFFIHNQTINIDQIKKVDHKTSTDSKIMAKNGRKTHFGTTSNVLLTKTGPKSKFSEF